MITTNGHEVVTGCVLDNHWGWHNHARMIAVATDLGYVISDDDQAIVDRYDAGDSDPESNDTEIVMDIMTEAENWLNENTPAVCTHCGKPVEPTTSGAWWVHVSMADRDACGIRFADHAQMYLWHWHDGDFFLSPMCENDDCDDDTCAHWSFQ